MGKSKSNTKKLTNLKRKERVKSVREKAQAQAAKIAKEKDNKLSEKSKQYSYVNKESTTDGAPFSTQKIAILMTKPMWLWQRK